MNGQRLTLLRVYLDEKERSSAGSLGRALMATAFDDGLAGATMFASEAGIGRARIVRNMLGEANLDHLPLVVQIADTDARIEAFCAARAELLASQLTTRETIWVVHVAGSDQLPDPVEPVPTNGRLKLVRMFCNEHDTTDNGATAVEAVAAAARTNAGLTMALVGIEGFGSHRVMHRHRLFHKDRSMPVMISALCDEAQLETLVAAAIEAFPGLTVTVESVTQVQLPVGGSE